MKKILYFVDRLRRGGIQSFLKVICANLSKEEFEISLLTLDDGNDYSELEKEFTCLGIKLFKFKGIWINRLSDYKKYSRELDNFFSKNKFEIAHINSGPKNYVVAKYAKKHGVKTIIYHSHNTDYQTRNILKKAYGNFLKRKIIKYCSFFLACSKEAGEWMYPKRIIYSPNFKIIHNPIILSDYSFDAESRLKIRSENNLNDCFVVGNVGRLSNQKNQRFLLEITKELKALYSNIKLVIVGTGELEGELKSLAQRIGVENETVFLGFRKDVGCVLNSFDLFVLPSFFEGYPISAIEAQANGLNCLMSDTITKEAVLNPCSSLISLKKGPCFWANYINDNHIKKTHDRVVSSNLKEYDVVCVLNQLIDVYNL